MLDENWNFGSTIGTNLTENSMIEDAEPDGVDRIQRLIEITVRLIQTEVLEDIAKNIVPFNVGSFGELHDYCDANCYGEFCDDDGIIDKLIDRFGGRDSDEGMPQEVMDFMNTCTDTVNLWLLNRKSKINLMQFVTIYDKTFRPTPTADIVSTNSFSEELCYDRSDMNKICNLEIGERWDSDFVGHYVLRIA